MNGKSEMERRNWKRGGGTEEAGREVGIFGGWRAGLEAGPRGKRGEGKPWTVLCGRLGQSLCPAKTFRLGGGGEVLAGRRVAGMTWREGDRSAAALPQWEKK